MAKEYVNIEYAIEEIIHSVALLKKQSGLIETIAKEWANALEMGHKVLFCGNGGSASDAQHLAAELIGRYKLNRKALAGLCLNTDTSAMTAIANDFGYDEVFARQVEGLGKKGDILVGISTSGNSQNILNAFAKAKELDITTIAFTGETGGKMMNNVDFCLNVPSQTTNNIQEMHIAAGHIMCDYVEKYFFGC